MESPRKFNDCYFYYYSTCTKGDNCVFRHEPSALGCETMCTAWQQGKCTDKRCKLRHMELRKNRKQIPCYWENQPGGCRKIHCPFMHKNPEARTDGIAPSQPAPPVHACLNESVVEQPPMGAIPPPAVPAPVPLLWQQQRQVVLDSTLLGVPRHDAGAPFAPLPVDPLVVNFDEESDNESVPSSTPTKNMSDDAQNIARSKSQELQLLEKIQAEAAAFYSYDPLPPVDAPKERKIVRTNLSSKYDKISLDEISGKTPNLERRGSLDFKVLSLDEIRAKKKETVVHAAPITLNLTRKRKLSTHEALTTSGNKIIKVVRSNSIVYKKMEQNASPVPVQAKVDNKQVTALNPRKRTLSEQTADVYESIDDELIDNCYEFKRVKITESTAKPRLIRNRLCSNGQNKDVSKDEADISADISDHEVEIVDLVVEKHIDLSSDTEVIDVDSTKMGDPIDIVDLSEDQEETGSSIELDKNVPDVVASCHKNNKTEKSEEDIINEIDALVNDDGLKDFNNYRLESTL